jgi:hypothetical protein
MRKLFEKDTVLEVIIQDQLAGKAVPQDAWVIRKR